MKNPNDHDSTDILDTVIAHLMDREWYERCLGRFTGLCDGDPTLRSYVRDDDAASQDLFVFYALLVTLEPDMGGPDMILCLKAHIGSDGSASGSNDDDEGSEPFFRRLGHKIRNRIRPAERGDHDDAIRTARRTFDEHGPLLAALVARFDKADHDARMAAEYTVRKARIRRTADEQRRKAAALSDGAETMRAIDRLLDEASLLRTQALNVAHRDQARAELDGILARVADSLNGYVRVGGDGRSRRVALGVAEVLDSYYSPGARRLLSRKSYERVPVARRGDWTPVRERLRVLMPAFADFDGARLVRAREESVRLSREVGRLARGLGSGDADDFEPGC